MSQAVCVLDLKLYLGYMFLNSSVRNYFSLTKTKILLFVSALIGTVVSLTESKYSLYVLCINESLLLSKKEIE